MIKAILFDLWNTLANTTGEWKTAFDEAGYYKNRKNDEIFEKSINMRCYVDERELAEQMCSLWGGLDIDKVEKLLKKTKSSLFDDSQNQIKKYLSLLAKS